MSDHPITSKYYPHLHSVSDEMARNSLEERVEDLEAESATVRSDILGLREASSNIDAAIREIRDSLIVAIGWNASNPIAAAKQFGAEHTLLMQMLAKVDQIEGALSKIAIRVFVGLLGGAVIGSGIIILLVRLLLDYAGAVSVGSSIIGQ